MANKGAWITSGYRTGDILIMDFDGKHIDHAGICIGVNPGGEIVTIEGNTGTGNDANGGAVMVRLRPLSVIVGACRPEYAGQEDIDKIIVTALREVGITENPSGSNRVKYNTEYDGRAEPWCVKFIWWVFRNAGLPGLFYGGGKTASSSELARYYGYGKKVAGVKITVTLDELRRGSEGASVMALQVLLNHSGHSPGDVDGVFGPKTGASVVALQKAKGLEPDEIVGKKTWEALLT